MLTKEQIIKEIQKYVKENNGNTPSEKKFYEYAQISLNDLHKLGWSNYRGLVLDAGLTPNRFDKTRYSHEQLCDIFIKFIREQGKWPTRGELDVNHFNNSNFPASATFYNKLGLTSDLARSILNFIEDKKGYEDIENICTPVVEQYLDNSATKDTNKTVDEVYMYKYKNQSQPIKVGRSKDSSLRGIQLAAGGHDKLVLLHSIKTDDAVGIEQYWHNRFRQLGREELGNEWFKLKPDDVRAFKRWKKIY